MGKKQAVENKECIHFDTCKSAMSEICNVFCRDYAYKKNETIDHYRYIVVTDNDEIVLCGKVTKQMRDGFILYGSGYSNKGLFCQPMKKTVYSFESEHI